jgi:hypothetical protein
LNAVPTKTGFITRKYEASWASHQNPKPYFWSYVSKGLQNHGQKEIIITVPVQWNRNKAVDPDRYPSEPMELLTSAYHSAKSGQILEAGDHYELHSTDLFDNPKLKALALVPSSYHHHLQLKPLFPGAIESAVGTDHLTGILLSDIEYEVSCNFGLSRVLARIGLEHSFFPFPPFSFPQRISIYPPEGRKYQDVLTLSNSSQQASDTTAKPSGADFLKQSVLSNYIRLYSPQNYAVLFQDEGDLVIQLSRKGWNAFQLPDVINSIDADKPIDLLLVCDVLSSRFISFIFLLLQHHF